jgi:hypothetical protein
MRSGSSSIGYPVVLLFVFGSRHFFDESSTVLLCLIFFYVLFPGSFSPFFCSLRLSTTFCSFRQAPPITVIAQLQALVSGLPYGMPALLISFFGITGMPAWAQTWPGVAVLVFPHSAPFLFSV